ncbi:MAG: hypothetical protein NVSMB52_20550 [Chloroflexota bacterium]
MTKPTYADATLMVNLAEWHTQCDLPATLNWVWSDAFCPDYVVFTRQNPPGSDGDRRVGRICAFFETVGTLYKHGLINEELIFDWLAVGSVWDRLKCYVLGRRIELDVPALWANFEALAIAHKRSTREYST